jgi:branched-chain amino acid transport system permease protein
MVIGGAGSIIGSLLGGAYYVLAPQLTNLIDPNLTAALQGAILLLILFILPGGLVSLPRLWRRKRGGGRPGGSVSPEPTPPTSSSPASHNTQTEEERHVT